MRENRTYGSEGGVAKLSLPLSKRGEDSPLAPFLEYGAPAPFFKDLSVKNA